VKIVKISIITVVRNDANGIEKTIKSIVNQTYKNIEYIVIDGNSSDDTLKTIQKYKHNITTIISQKDSGLYDAMNKGIKMASGDFINFINSGDILYDKNVVKNIVDNIHDNDKLYFSRAKIVGDGVEWVYPNYDISDTKKWLKLNLPNHQSMFFPRCFYKTFFYDLRFKIGADDDYKLYALKKLDTVFIDELYVVFSRDGVSSNHKSLKLFSQRLKESFLRNFKHKRYLRFFIDPSKLVVFTFINFLFGEKIFLKFVRLIVKIKG